MNDAPQDGGDDAEKGALTLTGATVDQLIFAATLRLEEDRRHAAILENTSPADVGVKDGVPPESGAARDFSLAITALEEAAWRANNGYHRFIGVSPPGQFFGAQGAVEHQRRAAIDIESKGIPF